MAKQSHALRHDVGRRHLYASASIAATFYDRATGLTLSKIKRGTTFVMNGTSTFFFVTNRHIVDYNYKPSPPSDIIRSAALDSVTIGGHFQPADEDADTIPWTLNFARPRFTYHESDEVDLAALAPDDADGNAVELASGQARWQVNNFDMPWLASAEELQSVLPGDQIYIAGYPGIDNTVPERPLLVGGIISSDPRYPATFAKERLEHSIFCHSFSWGGMSGAPVLGYSYSIGQSRILGVNAGHIADQGVSGGVISHFVRSDALRELVERMGEPPLQAAEQPAEGVTSGSGDG